MGQLLVLLPEPALGPAEREQGLPAAAAVPQPNAWRLDDGKCGGKYGGRCAASIVWLVALLALSR